MKYFLSITVAIAIALIVTLFFKELFLDSEARFGLVSKIAIVVLASLAAAGLLSLWLLPRRRKAIEGIWLSLSSTAIAYLVVDFIAGQLLLERLSPPIARDESAHHRLIPGTVAEFNTPEFNYIQRVNSLGFRGREIEKEKRPGIYRILMLGDSFTMGKGVSDENTFSALLEDSLNAAGRRVEVINAGVDSYSPILSYRQLVTRVDPALDPDLVVLNFDMSDLMQEVAYREAAIRDDSGEISGFRFTDEANPQEGRIRMFIASNLYFTRLLYAYLVNLGADDITVENTVSLINPQLLRHTIAGDDADRTGQWQMVFDSILKLRDYCNQNGIRFLLTAYPWGHQVNDREWVPGRYNFTKRGDRISDRSLDLLEQFASNAAIDFVNLFPAFRSYDGQSRLYFDNDMHWTPSGHRVMAEELERVISRKYLEQSRSRLLQILRARVD